MDAIRKTLLDKLEQCSISDFVLDAERRILKLSYKEDFDRYLKEFPGAKPMVEKDAGRKITPYGIDHFAFFEYEGWEISGNIVHHKPKKRKPKK